jgi:hypothetical protein
LNGIIVPAGAHLGWVFSNHRQEESDMNATTSSADSATMVGVDPARNVFKLAVADGARRVTLHAFTALRAYQRAQATEIFLAEQLREEGYGVLYN